jgi:hypothetical protein
MALTDLLEMINLDENQVADDHLGLVPFSPIQIISLGIGFWFIGQIPMIVTGIFISLSVLLSSGLLMLLS